MTQIIGLIIGLLLLAAGLYYLNQNKNDTESRKIYGITAAIGAMAAPMLLMSLIW